jgi:putative nucleotidyltransferase with HDIG domain
MAWLLSVRKQPVGFWKKSTYYLPESTIASSFDVKHNDKRNDLVQSNIGKTGRTMQRRLILIVEGARLATSLQEWQQTIPPEWSLLGFAEEEAALDALRMQHFDVALVSDTLPQSGEESILQQIRELSPETIRVVLVDPRLMDRSPMSLPGVHQILLIDQPVARLVTKVEQLLINSTLSENPMLARLIAEMETIPTLPSSKAALMELLQNPRSSIGEISTLVSADPALSAGLLRRVNSAYFNIRREVTNLHQAIMLLGLDTVRVLAQAVTIFNLVETPYNQALLQYTFEHSIQVGQLAKKMVLEKGEDPIAAEQAMLAGLLHDIGKLLLAAFYPRDYDATIMLSARSGRSLYDVESKVFGVDHARLGGYLLNLWGFHPRIVDAVADHHRFHKAREEPVSSAVCLANQQLSRPLRATIRGV